MTQLKNKTVFVTGASSGFGKEIAAAFAKKGSRLIIAARRAQRIKETAAELKKSYGIEVLAMTLDVRKKSDVAKAVKSLPVKWRDIDILVNNAGLSRGLDKLQEGSIQDWDEMIDTNVKGLLYVTRSVLPNMVKRNSSHIINIGSIAGHEVYPKGNVYCATKHAVAAINQGMRMDLNGTGIRVGAIHPGMVETEFSEVRFKGDSERASQVYKGFKPLQPEDIADIIHFVISRPYHVNIADLVVMSVDQASSTIVNKNL